MAVRRPGWSMCREVSNMDLNMRICLSILELLMKVIINDCGEFCNISVSTLTFAYICNTFLCRRHRRSPVSSRNLRPRESHCSLSSMRILEWRSSVHSSQVVRCYWMRRGGSLDRRNAVWCWLGCWGGVCGAISGGPIARAWRVTWRGMEHCLEVSSITSLCFLNLYKADMYNLKRYYKSATCHQYCTWRGF